MIEIVQPTVELIKAEASDLDVIHAMVISTQGDPVAWDDTKDAGRIGFLMRGRHGSPFEHNMFKFRVEAPIAVFREWHRHRIGFSYNEVSGRYSEMKPRFYIPPPERGFPDRVRAVPATARPGHRQGSRQGRASCLPDVLDVRDMQCTIADVFPWPTD